MIVGFLGLTHLGIVYSCATADRGVSVVQFDPDSAVTTRLANGQLGVSEPGLEELWSRTTTNRKLSRNPADLSACDLLFVVADVATDEEGRSNLDEVRQLVHVALQNSRPEIPVVIRSQVPPGFSRGLADSDRTVYYQVETLVFADAVGRASAPDRHIIGVADVDRPLSGAYLDWLELFRAPLHIMSFESAELAKISINLFLAASVSTTNSLAELCERVGANWEEIVPSLQADARIGPHAYLRPGLGISGGNLERDLKSFVDLAFGSGSDSRVIESFVANSEYRKAVVSRRLEELELPRESIVGMLGLAYKPGTASTKNSPSIKVIQENPHLRFIVHDPRVRDLQAHNVVHASDIDEVLASADVLLIMTPWRDYEILNERVGDLRTKKMIIDPFGVIKYGVLDDSLVRHIVLGRPQ